MKERIKEVLKAESYERKDEGSVIQMEVMKERKC